MNILKEHRFQRFPMGTSVRFRVGFPLISPVSRAELRQISPMGLSREANPFAFSPLVKKLLPDICSQTIETV
jgi:hypothetical protein